MSVWLPGFFGSLAAAPQQPGFSLTSIYYHTALSAGAEVSRAREITIGRFPVAVSVNLSADLDAKADLALALPAYTFATPVWGGQATVGRARIVRPYQHVARGDAVGDVDDAAGNDPVARSDSINDSVRGFGDVYPLATLRWNDGLQNVMTYVFGDVPVGAYDSTRLANTGVGHGAIDAGGGYTYFDPQTGHEFSGVLGFTYNFENRATHYQNGVDMHFDWGASQFLTKQFQVGLVGYIYKEIGCDSGSGDRVGCFQSQVVGVGPQLGFMFPVGGLQGYLNLKGYKEFAAENRPNGWNTWVTFTISPPASTPGPSPRRMITK